jgi:hypothetical protein
MRQWSDPRRPALASHRSERFRLSGAMEKRFFVKPDVAHLVPEVEDVVERHERYWVVEKIGVAGELAERQDPRSVAE